MRWIVWATICLLVGLIAMPAAGAQTAGSIQGVVMLAPSNTPMADIPVTLEWYEGTTLKETRTAQTDAGGGFSFDELAVGGQNVYAVSATYKDVAYATDMLTLTTTAPQQTVRLDIYETTDDDAGIVIERAHLIISPLAEGVQIGQMFILSNTGDKTFVGKPLQEGGQPATFRLYLPKGAEQITFDAGELGERFLSTPDGVADTLPIPPGQSTAQVVLSYTLPPQGNPWSMEYTFYYPVKNLNVLVSMGWTVEGAPLQFAGTMGGETPFQNYAAKDLAANTTLNLAFRSGGAAGGMTSTAAPPTPAGSVQGTMLGIAIGLGVLLLIGLMTYPSWLPRRPGRA
ncbi:MAG: carboxypeptidase-like regulatory domain-containing protein [Anaerolineae bacterium]